MRFHPYSEIFPLLDGSELDALAADIKEHGLREPIWTYKGQILDGRNRFLACQKAKIARKQRVFKGNDEAALAFVVSINIKRRHLTESQRAMAAARIATLKIGANQHEGASRDAPSQEKAAENMDISRSSVQRAKKVIEHGSKALQQAVEAGEVPLRKAAAVVDLPKSAQLAAATAPPEKPKPEDPAILSDRWVPEEDDEARIALLEKELAESVDKVMAADDKLAAAHAEIKRQAAEIATLKLSRDGFMNGKSVVTRMLKGEQRKTEKLERKLKQAEDELEKLRERISIMEAA